MKTLCLLLVCCVLCIFSIPHIADADEVITGMIIELSQNKEFIQVGDAIYQIEDVIWVDRGDGQPGKISREELEYGSIVRMTAKNQNADYWETSEVVLLQGEEEAEVLDDIGSSPETSNEIPVGTASEQRGANSLYLENGVWKN